MDLFDPVAGQEDTLTLQEMIDCDIRSDFDGVLQGTNFSCHNQTMEVDSPVAASFELDNDLPGGNHNMALMQQQTLYNADFEPTGLLVNPQTGLPTQLGSVNQMHRVPVQDQSSHEIVPLVPKDASSPIVEAPVMKWNQNPVQTSASHAVLSNSKKEYPKPSYSYSCLIAMALKNSATGSLPVSEIYGFMMENFPYFKTAPSGWKNSVRHNLSLNKCFEKIEKPSATSASQRKGCLWALNPAKINKMEEEVQKWSRKDPAAIKRSMMHPENFERLENGCVQDCLKAEFNHLSTPRVSNVSLPTGVTFKIKGETVDADLDLLDTNIPLDTSLPDLNLQSGIWDELEEDQVQFGVSRKNDEPSSVSVTLTATAGTSADKFSECNSKASIQSNYMYSQAVTLNNNTNLSLSNTSNSAQLLHKRCKIMSALM